jgi:Cu+-exporting ATPase
MDHAKHHRHTQHKHADGSDCHCDHVQDHAEADSSAIDPICGMSVQKANARYTSQYEGQTYYFCSDGCRVTFNKDPAAALRPTGNDR